MFFCEKCNNELKLASRNSEGYCKCNNYILRDGIYVSKEFEGKNIEMLVRDRQAKNYLKHAKFPTQKRFFFRWLEKNVDKKKKNTVLDLGCGPGPTTLWLLENHFEVVALDFSYESLKLNRSNCLSCIDNVTYIQQDLHELAIKKRTFDYVVMADFLQHLDGRSAREKLLNTVFECLKPGGKFYLSFFNINILNYFKGDIYGGFSEGNIKYERLNPDNLIRYFPPTITVENINPMNIFHSQLADHLASKMPLAQYLSRMISMEGTLTS